MSKKLKNISLSTINYLSVTPLLFFLMITNQSEELNNLLVILKSSSINY